MNQILETKTKKDKLKKFITIFAFSMFGTASLLIIAFVTSLKNREYENYSKHISNNYKIYKLYAEDNGNKINFYEDDDIIANITIPKINVNYPIFYGISDDLLKIAPCRFSGEIPPKKSNLCIAGHNYNDNRFFSKISDLDLEDTIIIEDNYNNKFVYYIYDKYEVTSDNIYNVTSYFSNSYELTLVTCNNLNNNRIIIKSKMKAYNQ